MQDIAILDLQWLEVISAAYQVQGAGMDHPNLQDCDLENSNLRPSTILGVVQTSLTIGSHEIHVRPQMGG
ncbi:hypothetical protein K443DRAFT_465304 [Laccaria amethystina LaAM-08-1]|jgi:hypothetical protein|uniref:Unplaced genomic scaffold K443scaffold_42, whole genome shotgun sequence n=1 Tax=Laccaria amethystina LaAM-08-1 TaxID=1095629 RepID=A0A0C9XFJ2_9AGAR|nr:hypothetical protein K443DRAFT_465304 [Laccaria amethystina LaAM-08-1]